MTVDRPHVGNRRVFATTTIANCGSYNYACLQLFWGHAVPPYDFIWEPRVKQCHNIASGDVYKWSTATMPCYPGYYYAEITAWNRNGGTQTAHKYSKHYDLTACVNG